MALTLTTITDIAGSKFDTIIDVRSPSEFAEDHLPGAINLPVLDDVERARIGTIYKQQSPFLARKLGAALVARNAARHLEGPLSDKPGSWQPLVYCWRGGQRSGSFATILSQVGWRVELIEGGYKSWRKLVVQQIQEQPVRSPVVVLDGNTGSAKTEILSLLAQRGVQIIDLEGLANHRGSVFGAMPGGQPGQKAFEGRLACALALLDPARPVVVEAESSKVGDRMVPKQLWAAMRDAARVRIDAPAAARAAYLARTYGDISQDSARLSAIIDNMRPLHAASVIDIWMEWVSQGAFELLARDLMERHYDPRYEKHRAQFVGQGECPVAVASLEPEALAEMADRIVHTVSSMNLPKPLPMSGGRQ